MPPHKKPTKPRKTRLPRLAASTKDKLDASAEDLDHMRRADLPSTTAVSSLLLTLGGLNEPGMLGIGTRQPMLGAAQASLRIQAAVDAQSKNDAEPMPSDIRAMLAFCEYIYRVEGDVAGTVDIPWEVIGKPIEIEAVGDDAGAKNVWNELWRQTDAETGMPKFNIDEIAEAAYLDIEVLGQFFPLEVWSADPVHPTLEGIAVVEPQSMWVGRSMKLEEVSPDGEDLPAKKLGAQDKALIYQSFVTDQNQQRLPGYRVDVRADRMLPIYAKKRLYKRYAIPHFTRAARNIMHRQILEEYRRGTVEQYLAQLWLFALGDPGHPESAVSPAQLRAFNAQVRQAVANHTGFISTRFPVESKSLAPTTLDHLLGNDTYDGLTHSIMRDLGFFLYILSGELPGASRGGGPQVELGLQLAIERWKYRTQRFVAWCEYLSRKYALKSDKALLKHLPKFHPGSIGIEQYAAIKERIMPLFAAGVLDRTNALSVAGFTYESVLANKKKEHPDDELFTPPPTFNQTASPFGGGTTQSQTAPQRSGRPDGGGKPKPSTTLHASMEDGDELEVYGRGEEFRADIDAHYDDPAFFEWMLSALETEMIKAYQDGFLQFGGLNVLDANPINGAPQGILFQMNRLQAFKDELNGTTDKLLYRPRALMYAGSVNLAYTLGVQQAMKSHGATEWQRILHPELSVAGPCAECQADSNVVHPMSEPFFMNHPHDVCSVQALRYSFAGRLGATIRIPDFIRKVVRRLA